MTKADVSESYLILKQNHPAAVPGENPEFLNELELGYQAALEKSKNCDSEESHNRILEEFTGRFRDGHLSFRARNLANLPHEPTEDFSINQVSPSMVWVTLPSFDPNQKQIQEFEHILSVIKNSRSSKAIVFDLRGNSGGDSEWAQKILKSLYGDDFYAYSLSKRFPSPIVVDWRASKANIERNEKVVEYVKRTFGTQSSDFQRYSKLIEGMKSALQAGKYFYQTSYREAERPKQKSFNPVSAKVYALTDSACFSACLDFMDYVFAFPNVTQVGQETGADTIYMEVNAIPLSSGFGEIRYPIKVYRNRLRKSNEAYVPKFTLKKNISEKTALAKWISTLK